MAYIEDVGSWLNDFVQKSKTRAEAQEVLESRGPVVIRKVADLNHIEFTATSPRKSTMIRAILDDRFGKA